MTEFRLCSTLLTVISYSLRCELHEGTRCLGVGSGSTAVDYTCRQGREGLAQHVDVLYAAHGYFFQLVSVLLYVDDAAALQTLLLLLLLRSYLCRCCIKYRLLYVAIPRSMQ